VNIIFIGSYSVVLSKIQYIIDRNKHFIESCEYGDDPSGCIKFGRFLDYLWNF
jgi:hypothetical protein